MTKERTEEEPETLRRRYGKGSCETGSPGKVIVSTRPTGRSHLPSAELTRTAPVTDSGSRPSLFLKPQPVGTLSWQYFKDASFMSQWGLELWSKTWDPENQRGALGTSPCLPRDVTRPPSPPPLSPFFPRFSPSVTQPPCNPSLPPHSSLSPRSSVFHGEEQNSTRALRANLRASPLRDSNSQGQRRRPPQCSRWIYYTSIYMTWHSLWGQNLSPASRLHKLASQATASSQRSVEAVSVQYAAFA